MICIAEHSSRRAGVLIIAPQAVNPGAPTDAGEVIDAIGESHILIAILARAVIIATQTISDPLPCETKRSTYSKNWQYQ